MPVGNPGNVADARIKYDGTSGYGSGGYICHIGEYEMTAIFDMMLADGLEVRMAPVEGNWRDVGRPEDLAAVNLPPETPDHRDQNKSAGDKHGR